MHIELYAWLLRILAYLNLDFGIVVRYNIYILHIAYHMIGDYYFLLLGDVYFNNKCTGLAFIFRLSNALYSDFMCRPFSNAIEEIMFVVDLYYFKRIYDDQTTQ